jgi:thiamine-phosphate pyrophosphorylase
MPRRQPALPEIWPKVWPKIWVVSDRRNDAALELILRRLPRGSGLIYRHYHLAPAERRARFAILAALARRRGHLVALAGAPREARRWRADASYGAPARGPGPRLVTAHSLREIALARRAGGAGCAAIVLSPVFATRSHPGARPLGPLRFRLLTRRAGLPVIALGGMTASRARRVGAARWAAIDGLNPKDS